MSEVKTIQQGDVLLRRIEYNAHDLEIIHNAHRDQTGKRLVVAQGEATGHSHVLEVEESDAELIRIGQLMLLQLEKTGVLTHPEHGTIEVPAGTYEVGKVREFDYVEQAEKQVLD